ncbi:sulfurtransferase TusA family protein [Phytohalomonas tamaricis]|uniref:sulfurtransferase TusA family protein n=1 Tax=Phytohalomonas tamaricis TaxID=2081032 RepID=UPI000D0ABC6E|nr:sulfurtransferase TusA family protein [Phytohalomonas tamaricis]
MVDQADTELDATGLPCPMPLLKAKQAIAQLTPGQRLIVSATDPGAWRDFESFVAQSQHILEYREENDGIYRFVIVKGGQ